MFQNKKEGKDQGSIQSSTTPDPGYQWESDNVTNTHHKRENPNISHPIILYELCTYETHYYRMALYKMYLLF